MSAERQLALALPGHLPPAVTVGLLQGLLANDAVRLSHIAATGPDAVLAAVMVSGMRQGGAAGGRVALSRFWEGLGAVLVLGPQDPETVAEQLPGLRLEDSGDGPVPLAAFREQLAPWITGLDEPDPQAAAQGPVLSVVPLDLKSGQPVALDPSPEIILAAAIQPQLHPPLALESGLYCAALDMPGGVMDAVMTGRDGAPILLAHVPLALPADTATPPSDWPLRQRRANAVTDSLDTAALLAKIVQAPAVKPLAAAPVPADSEADGSALAAAWLKAHS